MGKESERKRCADIARKTKQGASEIWDKGLSKIELFRIAYANGWDKACEAIATTIEI